MMRAAPLSECAARIMDSIVAGERSSSSIARTPAERIAVWLSASSRNSSSIENPLKSCDTFHSSDNTHGPWPDRRAGDGSTRNQIPQGIKYS